MAVKNLDNEHTKLAMIYLLGAERAPLPISKQAIIFSSRSTKKKTHKRKQEAKQAKSLQLASICNSTNIVQ